MSYLFDSFKGGLADGFKESQLKVRVAAARKHGYIHQGIEKVPREDARWVDDTWMYSYPEDTWAERSGPTLRETRGKRSDMESPAVGGAAYSMGGRNQGEQASVRRYKPDSWVAMQHGPLPMSTNAFQTYRDDIFGRFNTADHRAAIFYKYTPKSDSWKSKITVDKKTFLFNIHSATLGDKGYYFGGLTQPGGEKAVPIKRHRRYSASSGTWRVKVPLLDYITRGVGGGLNGWAFLFGGVDRGGGVKSITRAYSPAKDSWEVWNGNQRRAASMPGARSQPASFILPEFNSIFVTGGATTPSGVEDTTKTNFRFHVKTDTWHEMEGLLPSKRFIHGAFAL